MRILLDGQEHNVPTGALVCDTVRELSPFGADPVIVLLNGEPVDGNCALPLQEGDELRFYPLLIGG